MVQPTHYQAFLRQTLPVAPSSDQIHYSLSTHQSVVIGRDPDCQIILDSVHFQGVSRHHIEIRPLASLSSKGMPIWEVCDLGSANGTYVNGQQIQNYQALQVGDRIRLGQHGPEFIFDCQIASPVPHARPLAISQGDSLHLSQLLPIVSTQRELLKKAYLLPGVLTVLLVVGLFASVGNPVIFNLFGSIPRCSAA